MDYKNFEGKNVDDAITNACQELGITSDKLDYEVVEEGGIYHSAYDCVNGVDGASDTYYLTKDFYVEILNTGNYITKDTASAGNGKSVAAIFHYKNFTFFTAGDLTSSSEADLMKNEDYESQYCYFNLFTLGCIKVNGKLATSIDELVDMIEAEVNTRIGKKHIVDRQIFHQYVDYINQRKVVIWNVTYSDGSTEAIKEEVVHTYE